MEVELVNPEQYFAQRYQGGKLFGRTKIEVCASKPVYAYLVGEDGLAEFKNGDSFWAYGSSSKPYTKHSIQYHTRGYWYLLCYNPHDEPIAVGWRVS